MSGVPDPEVFMTILSTQVVEAATALTLLLKFVLLSAKFSLLN